MKHSHKDLATQLQQIADRFPHLNPQNSQPDGAAAPVRSLAEPPHCMVARRSDLNKRSLIPTLPKATWIAETDTPTPETSAATHNSQLTTHYWPNCGTVRAVAEPPLPYTVSLNEENTRISKQSAATHNSQLTTHYWSNCVSDFALSSFLLNHFHLEGARALRFLIQHPDEEFTALTLIQILSGTISYERYIPHDLMLRPPEDRDTLQESSIPMTDEKTLDAIKKRMDEIHTQKAKLQNRQPDCAELDAELDQLRKYLLECSRANGQLRSFNGVSRRPYQALCANINRVRKLLREHDPELDAYVARHLKTSPYFCWTSKTG